MIPPRCLALLLVTAVVGLAPPSLADRPSVEALAAWLPERPAGIGPSIADREAWERVRDHPTVRQQVTAAARFAAEPVPELTHEMWAEFERTGQRTAYQEAARARTTRLTAFVVAECVEDRGRHLGAIERELRALLAEPTWIVPAHAYLVPDTPGGTYATVDLAAAHRVALLATTDHLLGTRLPDALRAQLRVEAQARVFANYARQLHSGRHAWHWLAGDNNWNAVCHAGVLTAALSLIDSREERASLISAALPLLDHFVAGFADDGFCVEGINYWEYGFGSYLQLADLLLTQTGGRLDLFAGAKVREIAAFPRRFELADGIFPAFAAASLGFRAKPCLQALVARRFGWPAPPHASQPAEIAFRHGLGDRLHLLVQLLHASAVERSQAGPAPDLMDDVRALRTVLPYGEVVILRTDERVPRLALALKGGRNNVPHNHNDNGSYAVVWRGRLLLADPGLDDYTALTFGPERYRSELMNSYGHPVPVVAGTLQATGADAHGRIVTTRFTPDRDEVVMDLRSNYPEVPALRTLTRTFVFDRVRREIVITDEAGFTEPHTLGTAAITTTDWEQTGPAAFRVHDAGAVLDVRFESDAVAVRTSVAAVNGIYNDFGRRPGRFQPIRLGVTTEPGTDVTLRTVIRAVD